MKSFEDFHDVVLVKRVRSGDMSALECLVRRHQQALYTVAVAMLGDAAKAREATQMALLCTCGRVANGKVLHGFTSSAYSLLIDECLSVSRSDPPSPHDAPAEGHVPRGAASRRALMFDECRRVRAVLLQLRPRLRAIVVLRHVARLSCDEIAATLDLPPERVRTRLRSARRKLGQRLLGKQIDGPDGAAVLHELGAMLRMLSPLKPPAGLVNDVMLLIAILGAESVWMNAVID